MRNNIIEVNYTIDVKDLYNDLARSKKFKSADRDIDSISNKTESELEEIADKQVGEKLVFKKNKYTFDTSDLFNIITVHLPESATTYHDMCKNNVLTVRFYNLSKQ